MFFGKKDILSSLVDNTPKRWSILFVTLTLTLTPALASAQALPSPHVSNGRIVFSSNVEECDSCQGHHRWQIYVMNADGSGQKKVPVDLADFGLIGASDPSWSPDGTRIVFMGISGNSRLLYVINSDGSGQRRLSDIAQGTEVNPSWSPDGTKIAFVSYRNGNPEIYSMNADGTGQKRLTFFHTYSDFPSWSPDGTKIAFVSVNATNSMYQYVYVMNADGTGQKRLTYQEYDTAPTWSPDNSLIAFSGSRSNEASGIYVMNADGSGEKRVSFSSGDGYPVFSPDGKKIVYLGETSPDIYTMNLDGTNQTKIADFPIENSVVGISWAAKVTDTMPPTFKNVPPAMTVPSSNGTGIMTSLNVNYVPPTATDETDGPVTVICNPSPGAPFPAGKTTLVVCIASDSSGNKATTSFPVTVLEVPKDNIRPKEIFAELDGKQYPILTRSNAVNVTAAQITSGTLVSLSYVGSGQLEITLPTTLIKGIYEVSASKNEIHFETLNGNETSTTLRVVLPGGVASMEIKGAFVVPEFDMGVEAVIAGIMATVILTARVTRKNHLPLS